MFGVRLIFILAVMGGIIAYIADKLGSKIGKKKMTVFGLRPHYTSVLLTVLTGILIAACTIGVLAIASNSARTALFGMDKLQREMAEMTASKKDIEAGLAKALAELKDKNEAIAKLDAGIKEAQQAKAAAEDNLQEAKAGLTEAQNALEETQAQYATMQGELVSAQTEVGSLTEAKAKLSKEIAGLQERTAALQKGLENVREGQLLYRGGEVVFAGVLKSNLSEDEENRQLTWLLQGANNAALSRLGLEENSRVEAIWISKEEFERVKEAVRDSKTDLLVRVRALGNTVTGEPVVCRIDMVPNKQVYSNNQLIYRKIVNLDDSKVTADAVVIAFLRDVNRMSVEAGVLPDPVSGKVGNMEAASIVELVKRMQKMGGQAILSAYAKGDITTAGPVLLKMDVEKILESR